MMEPEDDPLEPYRRLAEMGVEVIVPRPPKPPDSLSESLGGAGVCPVPFTHDRLREAHHWWHEMAHFYHEPEPFRYRLGAFINAARSVTFMLQSKKARSIISTGMKHGGKKHERIGFWLG